MWEEFISPVMNFILNVFELIKEKLIFAWRYFNSTQNSPPPPPPLPTFELETESPAQIPTSTTAGGQSQITSGDDSGMMWMHWSLIGVCVAVIATTVQALQPFGQLFHSASFHWIAMALVFSSTAVLVSISIPGHYKKASVLAVRVGIFIAFTGFVAALAINLPLPFIVASIAVCSLGILIIIFANLYKPS